ncbi:MAG: tyrosine--tRNA ligase [Flammeovirgaceae bacterium]|nr:tyrosine--tRNA ligase [Flammeovirgaceae bacterium]
MNNFVEELKWRGMLHDIMPGTEDLLLKESTTAYIGFDPTADSLHIGSLAQIMTLVHFQKCGHKPIALVGGATGMIGDPSGKKEERKLLTVEDIQHNAACIKKQLEKFLDFKAEKNPAELVNNNDWFQGIQMIAFLRDAGKYLTVNYLLSKGFIKDRLAQGGELSFTEFNYILMQAYDFMWLYEHKNCKLQMGGSDQWGNITAGTDLIHKKLRGEAYGLTCKLITKSDGSKFGKTESGNVWLDPAKTSPYKFYQFWLNCSDEDATSYIRIFTLKSKEEINTMMAEHANAPHLRKLQHELAKDITIRVHSQTDYEQAVKASNILFGNSTTEDLQGLDEETLLSVFEGVPQVSISKAEYEFCASSTDLLSTATKSVIFSSKGEARKMIQAGGVSINKEKVADANAKPNYNLLQGKYLLAQKGKKNYYLMIVE